jgi:predicted transglutaminase-like cysteine proteinase
MKFGKILLVAILTAISLAAAEAALAQTRMQTGERAVPPAGFLGFCAKHLSDCLAHSREAAIVELNDERRSQLERVQTRVNAAIRPREDAQHVWDYPTVGTGDCNRYALAKRRDLLALGFPQSALLLATALTERGEGHLVLVVRTDRGDLVLDNRVAHTLDWSELPYRWISMQSPQSPVQWLRVLSRPIATADARGAAALATK